jgi:Uma2 family endonuclease
VPEYWIVDLDQRHVERWKPGDTQPAILTGRLTWQPVRAAPPFELDLQALFEACTLRDKTRQTR